MSVRFMLNETSYFGKGAREELAGEINKRGFKKVFLVSDKSLVEASFILAKYNRAFFWAGLFFKVAKVSSLTVIFKEA